VSAETLRRAHAVHPVVDVQIEWSLLSRSVERSVLPAARELGVGITAYGVLSPRTARRSLAGRPHAGRAGLPRAQPALLGREPAPQPRAVEALRAVAAARGATVAQLAVAWALHRGPDVVPLVGARRRDRLTESLGALDVELTASELAQLEEAVPDGAAAGERYAPAQMAALDSER
jgi:aryl-alcohol dehydrogenase-like predicted oxidoreductase